MTGPSPRVASAVRHPCLGQSPAARRVFEQIAVGNDKGHHPGVLGRLRQAGLVTLAWRTVGRDAFGLIRVPVYEVPIAVHMQWCEWCAIAKGKK